MVVVILLPIAPTFQALGSALLALEATLVPARPIAMTSMSVLLTTAAVTPLSLALTLLDLAFAVTALPVSKARETPTARISTSAHALQQTMVVVIL